MGCLGAEFVPVVSFVANEVGDFTEGLIQDGCWRGMFWCGGGSVDDDEL